MLGRLDFCEKWIMWIKAWLESSSPSMSINGSPTKEFHPQKGLCEGDPLAPFFFLLWLKVWQGCQRKQSS